jgi:hypothetical protein
LLELRGRVAQQRRQIKFREQPVLAIAVFVGVLLLGLFGIRREDS